jgi:REP element-mobilizing transposase RayT
MVTKDYKCVFGKIIDGEMHLNSLGNIVENCWLKIPEHFLGVDVETYIVMPNHIHGIISIFEDNRRGTIYRAPTKQGNTHTSENFGQPVIGSIPTIVRTYKAAVSRLARKELGMVNVWQRNYYEHIIRDQDELINIHNYILSNPDHWTDDPENIH